MITCFEGIWFCYANKMCHITFYSTLPDDMTLENDEYKNF